VLTTASDDLSFSNGPAAGTMKSFVVHDANAAMHSWQLKIKDLTIQLDKLWLIVRFVLT
jgi:hypothetical protein